MDETKVMETNAANSGLSIETVMALREKMLKERASYRDELAHLDREVSESGDDLVPERGGLSNHIADDADEVTEQEKDMALRRNTETLLELVERALSKMEQGKYGSCEVCGKQIGERLEVRPYVRYCITDQAKEEAKERQMSNQAQFDYSPRIYTPSSDEE